MRSDQPFVSPETERSTHDALADARNEHVVIYIDGALVPRSQASVSVFDSGFLVGDGVWEGIRYHEGTFLFLDRHLNRLFQGAATIGLNLGMTREDLVRILMKTIRANGMTTGVHVRLMVTRGIKKTPSQDPRLTISGPTIVVIAEYKEANPETARRGIRLFTAATRRGSPDYLDPQLNCHSKIHEVIALNQALAAGADEALMLDIHGFVATCNATNFFIVRGNEVWTSTGRYCLNGVTRGIVIELCRQHDISVRERDFTLTNVYGASEAFVTGTFGGLTPVVAVDGRQIGSGVAGPRTVELRGLYARAIAAQVELHRSEFVERSE
jgi:branched-chain amino acid aminotransferase